ncbi:MAG: hypothetical protein Q9195_002731 [Heterodermia aff. obscurata]
MLSFLQNQLGRRSSPLRPDPRARVEPTRPSLSRSSSAVNASSGTSEAPSLTPPTSNTDAASLSEDATAKSGSIGRSSDRPRRVRSSIGSYNESVLSGTDKRRPRRMTSDGFNRIVSGETLVEGKAEAQDQLIKESVQVLNEGWELSAMPSDSLEVSVKEESGSGRRRSTRLELVGKTATMVEKTSIVLGKRGLETVDAGITKLKGLKGGKSSSLRTREAEVPSFEGPVTKKARFSDTVVEAKASQPSSAELKRPRRPTKRWLSQGLYVGQERDFDPKLNEAKNQSKRKRQSKDRQRSFLPLPMFAGERTLENGRHFRLPFDVYSPLPPGQPKPDEWRKTHKKLRERCKTGSKYHIGVEVCKTLDRGHGLRSNRTFEPNQIIIEYTGEIITQDECDDRMRKRYKNAECYYLMDFDQQMILDATRGSIARFINHSCEPNCKMIKWTVSGKPRMALFAGDKGIMTGDELTYDYNFDPYSTKNVQECRCGAPSCRGVLGPKPKETKDIKDTLKPLTTGGKRKFRQALEDTVGKVTKKRKVTIPTSVRAALSKVKAQTTANLSKAYALTATSTQNEQLAQKISERSLRGIKRSSLLETSETKVTKKTIVAMARRRSANGTFLKGGPIGLNTEEEEKDVKVQEKKARPADRKDSEKAKADTVKKNKVRTIRKSSRAGNGKTIWVIGDDDKMED